MRRQYRRPLRTTGGASARSFASASSSAGLERPPRPVVRSAPVRRRGSAGSAATSTGSTARRLGRRRHRPASTHRLGGSTSARPVAARLRSTSSISTIGAGPSGALGAGRGERGRLRPRRRAGRTGGRPSTSSGPSAGTSVRVALTSHTAAPIITRPSATSSAASTNVVEPVEPRRGGAAGTARRSCQVQRWWAGHQMVVRPPTTVRWSGGAVAGARPAGGAHGRRQRAGVTAAAAQHHGEPAADRRAAGRRPRRPPASAPDAAGRARPTTAPRRRACCRARRPRSGRAGRPSAAPGAAPARPPARARRQRQRVGPERVEVRVQPDPPEAGGGRGTAAASRRPGRRPSGPSARRRCRRRRPGARSPASRRRAAAAPSCRSAARSTARRCAGRAPCRGARDRRSCCPASASSTPARDHERVGPLHGDEAPADEVGGGPPGQLDLQDLRHRPSLAAADAKIGRHVERAVGRGRRRRVRRLLYVAYAIEPHWVAKDGRRFLTTSEVVDRHGATVGRRREVRGTLLGDGTVMLGKRALMRTKRARATGCAASRRRSPGAVSSTCWRRCPTIRWATPDPAHPDQERAHRRRSTSWRAAARARRQPRKREIGSASWSRLIRKASWPCGESTST